MNAPLHRPPLLARINWYWTFQLAGWGAIGLLTLLSLSYQGLSWAIAGTSIWGAASGLALSIPWRRWLRRQQLVGRHADWKRIVPALLALGTLQTVLVALGYFVLRPFGHVRSIDWLPSALASWTGIFLVWTVLYAMVQSLRRASRFEAEALRLEVLAKDAQLRALQAQVNPHFFFNSLNSVRALIFEDREAAAHMIDQLANLMRHALQSSQHATVPLSAELDAVRAYLAIEQCRFEDRLRVSFAIEISAPDLDHVHVPPMALQTLVENAVQYGVETSADGGDIRITAQRSAGMNALQIEVANTGELRSASGSTGIGLRNARQRLQLACGEHASLELRQQAGWVYATIHLPEKI